MSRDADVLVVGSGPSAVHAALPLVEAGVAVTMLDVGHEDDRYASLIPDLPFHDLRRADARQHRYLLGDDYEALPLGGVRVGAQLTPPRSHVLREAGSLAPLESDDFRASESLALGGLGAAWGASAVRYDDRDLAGIPLAASELAPHYEAVARSIGISGARDDLLRYYGDLDSLQPPLTVDPGVERLMERYASQRARLNARGFHLGHPRLAVLSRDLGDRSAQAYRDLDFYSDAGRSVYRPAFTLELLRRHACFAYRRPWLVERFDERSEPDTVVVHAREGHGGVRAEFRARYVVLAAGTLGTARIVLRSLDRHDTPVPLVCNPHVYVPCLHLAWIGRAPATRRHSLTQAGIVFDPPGGQGSLVYGEAHVYGSLLLFKLARESALPLRRALRTVRELVGAFVILVLEHEDEPSPEKTCTLRHAREGSDALHVDYRTDASAERHQRRAESRLLRCVRGLGCVPIGRVDPGPGSSIHYAGTFPLSDRDLPLTTDRAGRLRGTRAVFLADGSVLARLPAKPLTFTLMANARRTGCELLRELR